MAKIKGAIITLTETTLRELLHEVERRKEDKLPSAIQVKSVNSDIIFEISLEKEPNTQESLGYIHSYPIIK